MSRDFMKSLETALSFNVAFRYFAKSLHTITVTYNMCRTFIARSVRGRFFQTEIVVLENSPCIC